MDKPPFDKGGESVMVKSREPMIIEENFHDYGWCNQNSGILITKKSKDRAKDFDTIKEYLNEIADGNKDHKIGIYMKVPYADKECYVVVGPTFAALMLRDYELTERVLQREKKLELEGYIITCKDYNKQGIWICLDELFLADMSIPAQLLKSLHEKIVKKRGYTVLCDICGNDLLQVMDAGFTECYDFGFGKGKAPFGNRFECLKKKCPEMFEAMIEKMATDQQCRSVIADRYERDDAVAMCRLIYRYSGNRHKEVLEYFRTETQIIKNECIFPHPVPEYYGKDAKAVYRLLKGDKDVLKEYARILLYVTTIHDIREINRIAKEILNDRSNSDWTVDDLRLLFYGKPNSDPIFADLHNNRIPLAVEGSIPLGEYYVEYLAKLMAKIKAFTGKKLTISGSSALMYEYFKAVEDFDFVAENIPSMNSPFGSPFVQDPEDRVRDFRKIMKQFISKIDNYEYSEPRTRYETLLVKLADEELMVWHFEKGMLRTDKIPDYIQTAIKLKRTYLLPCLTAYQD